jgi:CBS domain-containing protein
VIRDVMTTQVVTVEATTPFKDIVARLARHRVSAVPVVQEDGRLIGIVSEADLLSEWDSRPSWLARLSRITGGGRRGKAKATVAAELATVPARTIGPNAGLAEATKMFHEHGMKRLPVVDADGRLVGIVSRSDVLSVYLRPDTEILQEIRHELRDRLWIDPGSLQVTVENGVVTLDGRLDRKSSVSIVDRVVRRVAGVISVENHLTCRELGQSRTLAPRTAA